MKEHTEVLDSRLHRELRNRGRIPLWAQVKASLVEMISSGQFKPGDQLPSEADLCARYGVSRPVVREALSQLVFEQLVFKHQGKGAFVAARRDDEDFVGTTIGFSDELADKNRLVTRRILRQEIAEPSPRARQLLRLGPQEKVAQVDRVMIVDGVPRLLVRISIRQDAAPGLERQPLENRSLYETLRRQYGLVLRRAERWIDATLPSHEEAKLLDISVKTPVLQIESISYGNGSDPIEYFTAIHRTDRARLHFVIK